MAKHIQTTAHGGSSTLLLVVRVLDKNVVFGRKKEFVMSIVRDAKIAQTNICNDPPGGTHHNVAPGIHTSSTEAAK